MSEKYACPVIVLGANRKFPKAPEYDTEWTIMAKTYPPLPQFPSMGEHGYGFLLTDPSPPHANC